MPILVNDPIKNVVFEADKDGVTTGLVISALTKINVDRNQKVLFCTLTEEETKNVEELLRNFLLFSPRKEMVVVGSPEKLFNTITDLSAFSLVVMDKADKFNLSQSLQFLKNLK